MFCKKLPRVVIGNNTELDFWRVETIRVWNRYEVVNYLTRLNSQNLIFFVGQISIFRHYCIQNVKDGIRIQVYNINNEIVNHFGQLILAKVGKNFWKSQTQFREMLRNLRLKQNYGFLINKKTCIFLQICVVKTI